VFPEGTPDLQALLQQAAQMQEQLMSTQQQLEAARVEGSAGGGLVHATVTGTGELVQLRIDPDACDPDDTETLADLILAAVHNAVDNAKSSAAGAVGDLSGAMPTGFDEMLGGGLSGLMGSTSGGERTDNG
jgi:DNA-binding YbaB/EbfC family protein